MSLGLEVRDLVKSYGRLPVLAGLSFTVRPREIVAIVGPSGCGKSTLLDVLAGLTPYDRGEVLWDGRTVPHLAGRVAYMHQKDLLLPWRSAADNALLGAWLRGRRAEAAAALPGLFHRLGLRGFEGARPASLSGGMRQRVALARTFLSGGELWLLDEPFSAVDAITRGELQDLLLALWGGQPLLFVTHDVEEGLRLADRVLLLTARPARVLSEIEVPLPRPRPAAHGRLTELKARLLAELRRGMAS